VEAFEVSHDMEVNEEEENCRYERVLIPFVYSWPAPFLSLAVQIVTTTEAVNQYWHFRVDSSTYPLPEEAYSILFLP
jgi:hypothetical protein